MTARKNKDIIQDIHDYNININAREIFLSNQNHEDNDINSILAAQFVKNLRLLDSINNEPIKIHLLAGNGGDVNAGIVIYNSILNSKSHITMIVYDCAASMSSVILQSADTRILHKNSYLMLHYGYIAVDAGWISIKSLMEKVNKDQERDLNIYISRMKAGEHFQGWSESKIRKFIKSKLSYKEDWYITSDEAIIMGLADSIIEG